ncbi:vitelline membrane outer layer protein 1-like isoform X1 [Labeo rohita]|uniref:vitelline membrane outer layer protein 1-like isoform X1 n=1 Tax=Labeo rohita TaxID=84645 RepID=UPI0021E20E3A|nr:vitelline membrane outer layer protein 1-like isoform X1 [Labeo rohita]
MNHFISVMFSLLVFTGLQVSVEAAGIRFVRSMDRHYRSELKVPNGGRWGSWGQRQMCPIGMYAAGFSLKVEDPFNWDETALNGIRLHCIDSSKGLSSSYDVYTSIQSDVGSWGHWTDIKWCPSGFLTDFRLNVETPQGTGDDTAANNIMFECSGGSFLRGGGTGWGFWGGWSGTCQGKWICGIRTKVEEPQGIGDDTALNDVIMYCCE